MLAPSLTALLDSEAGSSLTPRIHNFMAEVRKRWHELGQRIAALDAEFAEQARTDENARRLTTIPGIGALNATALVAAIGDVATFARGRGLAACLGLVPRQVTTGGKPRLVGITKRGSKYLRKTLRPAADGKERHRHLLSTHQPVIIGKLVPSVTRVCTVLWRGD